MQHVERYLACSHRRKGLWWTQITYSLCTINCSLGFTIITSCSFFFSYLLHKKLDLHSAENYFYVLLMSNQSIKKVTLSFSVSLFVFQSFFYWVNATQSPHTPSLRQENVPRCIANLLIQRISSNLKKIVFL